MLFFTVLQSHIKTYASTNVIGMSSAKHLQTSITGRGGNGYFTQIIDLAHSYDLLFSELLFCINRQQLLMRKMRVVTNQYQDIHSIKVCLPPAEHAVPWLRLYGRFAAKNLLLNSDIGSWKTGYVTSLSVSVAFIHVAVI